MYGFVFAFIFRVILVVNVFVFISIFLGLKVPLLNKDVHYLVGQGNGAAVTAFVSIYKQNAAANTAFQGTVIVLIKVADI
ncbi:hypothetical protein D3C71_1186740 [compost metagenome]